MTALVKTPASNKLFQRLKVFICSPTRMGDDGRHGDASVEAHGLEGVAHLSGDLPEPLSPLGLGLDDLGREAMAAATVAGLMEAAQRSCCGRGA